MCWSALGSQLSSVLNTLQVKVVFVRKYGIENVVLALVAEGRGRVLPIAQLRKVCVAPLDAFYEVVAFPVP